MEFEIKRKNAFQSLLVYIAVMYIISNIISILMSLILKQTGTVITKELLNTLNGILQLLIYLILFAGLYVINKKEMTEQFKILKQANSKASYRIISGFCIFYLCNLVISAITTGIDSAASFYNNVLGAHKIFGSVSENQNQIEALMHSGGAIPMFISAVFFGPICEELVFRKSIFNLTKYDEVNLLISSLLFGSIHLISSIGTYSFVEIYTMGAAYIASGLALGYVYLKNDKNIWIPIAIHIISNFISMLGILFVK